MNMLLRQANRSNWTEEEKAWAEAHINAKDPLDRLTEAECNDFLSRKRGYKEPKKELTLAQYMYEVAGTLD